MKHIKNRLAKIGEKMLIFPNVKSNIGILILKRNFIFLSESGSDLQIFSEMRVSQHLSGPMKKPDLKSKVFA